jgi:hypothetical protein
LGKISRRSDKVLGGKWHAFPHDIEILFS